MRSCGVLLPVFSLPGDLGIGDFSEEAYKFIDDLSEAGQSYWQILPMSPLTEEDCPYQTMSCFGGEPLYISPARLEQKRLISSGDIAALKMTSSEADPGRVDYQRIRPARTAVLRKAFRNFEPDDSFFDFVKRNENWLPDYALYRSIMTSYDGGPWPLWDAPLRDRDEEAIEKAKEDLKDEILFHEWTQYEFFDEWSGLVEHAHNKGIKIVGDIAYYAGYESCDVWANRELFRLDENGERELVSGAPPDGFTPEGQCWGNPVYDWEKQKEDGYSWWLSRIANNAAMYDVIRFDHMRGFESYFAIPEKTRDPKEGHWEKGPGMDLIGRIKERFPSQGFIAEDLGYLTPEVKSLISDSGFPGMKVLQFAFDGGEDNTYLPFNYDSDNTVVYTGTHDNDTTLGWYEKAEDWKKRFATWYIREKSDLDIVHDEEEMAPEEAAPAMVELAYSTRADYCVVPMQDHLALGSEARINVPGVRGGNWDYRMKKGEFSVELKKKMADLASRHGRHPVR